MNSYWHRIANQRLNRRRALGGTVAASTVALSLATCGEASNGATTKGGDKSGLVYVPEDTSARAKPGGTLRSYLAADVTTFDVLSTTSFSTQQQVAAYAYQRLIKFTPGKYPETARGSVDGDAVESYELSPDKLQLTMKVRPNQKLDPRAPTHGRALDADDIVFSWNKFNAASPFKADIAFDAALAPGSALESLKAIDQRTIVIRLKQPDPDLVALLGFERLFWAMPRESDGGFDPRGEVRGSGPWQLLEYKPSALRVWQKNPDYYLKGRPFFDRLEQPIVPEYATRLAQFRAGNIWVNIGPQQEDIIPTKRALPDVLLGQDRDYPIFSSSLAFGYGNADTPWKDERMRQAASLLVDREALIDNQGARKQYEAEGLDIRARYHTVIGAGAEGYWIDPQDDKKFGPNAKYYSFDPPEAKKLMTAAGFPNGVETLLHYNGGTQYGVVYTKRAELISGMLSDGGVRAKPDPRTYQTDWLPNYHYGYTRAYEPGRSSFKGFTGIIYRAVTGYPTVGTQVYSTMNANGIRFEGSTPDGKSPEKGDPEVNDLTDKIRREFDVKRQQQLAGDLQRLMAKKAYHIPYVPFAYLLFTLNWPVIGNVGLYSVAPGGSPPSESTTVQWWIDDSKPPLGKKS